MLDPEPLHPSCLGARAKERMHPPRLGRYGLHILFKLPCLEIRLGSQCRRWWCGSSSCSGGGGRGLCSPTPAEAWQPSAPFPGSRPRISNALGGVRVVPDACARLPVDPGHRKALLCPPRLCFYRLNILLKLPGLEIRGRRWRCSGALRLRHPLRGLAACRAVPPASAGLLAAAGLLSTRPQPAAGKTAPACSAFSVWRPATQGMWPPMEAVGLPAGSCRTPCQTAAG
mmetsp:Transcript_27952/g.79076  ORF Transcript_27952/g.79076 Transcript_27952/m.79076 type:complete len:228 (+) Transcript_27952:206-889(+)